MQSDSSENLNFCETKAGLNSRIRQIGKWEHKAHKFHIYQEIKTKKEFKKYGDIHLENAITIKMKEEGTNKIPRCFMKCNSSFKLWTTLKIRIMIQTYLRI